MDLSVSQQISGVSAVPPSKAAASGLSDAKSYFSAVIGVP